jgi:hypothetical protein
MDFIIAKKGITATLQIAGISIVVGSSEPVDLTMYNEEQLKNSNLDTLIQAGWVVDCNEQSSVPTPSSKGKKITIPKLHPVERKISRATFTQTKVGARIQTQVTTDDPENFADQLHQRVIANKEAMQHGEEDASTISKKKYSNSDVSSENSINPVTPGDLKREGVGSYVAPPKEKPSKGIGAAGPVQSTENINEDF